MQVGREQHEVVVRLHAGRRAATRAPVPRRHVRFHPQNGLHARLFRLFLELPGGMHVTVIGDRERRHFEMLCALDQIIDTIRAVEERIFRVAVQVNERHDRE